MPYSTNTKMGAFQEIVARRLAPNYASPSSSRRSVMPTASSSLVSSPLVASSSHAFTSSRPRPSSNLAMASSTAWMSPAGEPAFCWERLTSLSPRACPRVFSIYYSPISDMSWIFIPTFGRRKRVLRRPFLRRGCCTARFRPGWCAPPARSERQSRWPRRPVSPS